MNTNMGYGVVDSDCLEKLSIRLWKWTAIQWVGIYIYQNKLNPKQTEEGKPQDDRPNSGNLSKQRKHD